MNELHLFKLPWTWFAFAVLFLSIAIVLNTGVFCGLFAFWAIASFVVCLVRIDWSEVDF